MRSAAAEEQAGTQIKDSQGTKGGTRASLGQASPRTVLGEHQPWSPGVE